jgi:hypothetical protein
MLPLLLIFVVLVFSPSKAFRTFTSRPLSLNEFSNRELSSRMHQKHSHVTLSAKRRTTLSRGKGRGESQEVVKEDLPDSVMSPTSNQSEQVAVTVTTAASIPNTDNTEIKTTAVPANKGRQLSQRIQDDISDFERMGALREKKTVQEENNVTKTLKNIFSAVFIADFFVVIVFLIWFLAAAVTQKSNPFLLEKFQVSMFVYDLIAVQCLYCAALFSYRT